MTPLDQARAISDALLTQESIPLPEVTELPPAEGALQWRMAQALQDFEITRPMWEIS